MKLRLFSIYDMLAGVYLTPFPARSDVDATRQISASFDNPQMRDTPVFRNPDHFALYEVGSFDDETGFVASQTPIIVSSVAALMPPRDGAQFSS